MDEFKERAVTDIEFEAAGKPGEMLAAFSRASGVTLQVSLQSGVFHAGFNTEKTVSRASVDGRFFGQGVGETGRANSLTGALKDLFKQYGGVGDYIAVRAKGAPAAECYKLDGSGVQKYSEEKFRKITGFPSQLP